MSVLSVDFPTLSTALELPYTVQPPATQLGLANLTLWLNSEISNQLQAGVTLSDSAHRAFSRDIARAVVRKMESSASQPQLVWLIRKEVDAALAAMGCHERTHGCEFSVVPTEMHHPMTRTPLPALHPLLRTSIWIQIVQRWVQRLVSKVAGGFAPESPSV